MARMKYCAECKRHALARDTQCRHCGADLSASQAWEGMVRGVKVGGLMLFTALTTTACYGGPKLMEAPIEDPATLPPSGEPVFPSPTPTPTPEPPEYKIPTQSATAYAFWTPKGERTQSWTLKGFYGQTADGVLSFFSDPSARTVLIFNFELPSEGIPAEVGGIRPGLSMDRMGEIDLQFVNPTTLEVIFGQSSDVVRPSGTLQVAELDDGTMAGVLLIDRPQGTLQLYFRTPHRTYISSPTSEP